MHIQKGVDVFMVKLCVTFPDDLKQMGKKWQSTLCLESIVTHYMAVSLTRPTRFIFEELHCYMYIHLTLGGILLSSPTPPPLWYESDPHSLLH